MSTVLLLFENELTATATSKLGAVVEIVGLRHSAALA